MGLSLAPSGGQDGWGRPSDQGNSPFSDSGSDIDVVVDSDDARHSVTDAGSDGSTGGAAGGGGAKRRAHFLEDNDDDDEMDYRSKLAGVADRQLNESDSEFVPSGEEEVEVEEEEDLEVEGEEELEVEGEEEEGEGVGEEEVKDNVSVQSFSSGGSSGFEAGAAGHRKMAVAGVRRKQGRVVDDDVSCIYLPQEDAVLHTVSPLSVCLCVCVQFWEVDPSMYGLRRSNRVQKDFTATVDYVG